MGTLTDEDLRHLLGEAAGSFPVPEDGPGEVLAERAEEAAVVPRWRSRPVQLVSAAAVVAVGIALGGSFFGGSGVDRIGQLAGGERAATDGDTGSVAGPVPANGGVGGSAGGGSGTGTGTESSKDARLLDLAAGSTATRAAPGNAPPAPAAPVPAAPTADGARVVKTGAIALVVDDGDVTQRLTQVQQLAAEAGGEVSDAKTSELGPTPSGTVTLRVPVDRFEEVVAAVRSLEGEVRAATTSGQDVTVEYADLEAQIRTLTAARERFLEILTGARTIGDVLAVQQRVDDVTGRIDRLEGQRRVLAAQSERATLQVTVTEADDPAVRAEEPDDGLSKAFSDAWHGFTSGVEGLIRLSGRGVLLLLCLMAGYVLIRLGWRASRRRLV